MMRIQRYITRELVPPLVTGTLLFTAIVSFGYFFVSSQFLANAPVLGVLRYIGLQVPDTLVRVFPMAVVLMVVVAYGRLANERELGAAQAGGLSLLRLSWPAVLIAAFVSAFSLFLSEVVVPQANQEARSFYWDDLTGAGLSTLAGRTLDIGNAAQPIELRFDGYDNARRELRGVRLQAWQDRRATIYFAGTGTYEGNTLRLSGYRGYVVDYAAIDALSALPENADEAAFRGAVQNVFVSANIPADPKASIDIDTGLSRKQAIADLADAIAAERRSLSELWTVITDRSARPSERLGARIELNRKLALPFGNLVLVLAALPFALRFGRTTGVALGVALLITIAYYLVYILGLSFTNSGLLPPEIGAWLANIVFVVVGLWMLRRTG
ncbi:LptF/LptG family permease [Deinococcus pimensis]|uniref:LptF/LptG family permease n=1 Tax=Deinococcus pimensis TaxID=309888 RepID=UPI00048052A0|nr:LptF/LptG family permease [Deinococcus pimensis]